MMLKIKRRWFWRFVHVFGLSFLFFVYRWPVWGYDSTNFKLGPWEFADTHYFITTDAYYLGKFSRHNYPDLIKFEEEIFKGSSDEGEAHQGSDKLAGNTQNQLAWFGDQSGHWQQVLKDYHWQNFQEVYQRIGAMLHLTADATVPAHVRICPHGKGSERYFGNTPNDKTSAQPTFESDLLPPPLNYFYKMKIDHFETVVDRLAVKRQIPLAGVAPRKLPAPDDYLAVTREAMRQFLDRDPYWDQYWAKTANLTQWGRYGSYGDIFPMTSLGGRESALIIYAYNLAVIYSSGQMAVVSEKLPPLTEALSLSPSQFGEEGTKIAFVVQENRTKTVKVKITVAETGSLPIVDEQGKVYDGSLSLELKESSQIDQLPYYSSVLLDWQGKTAQGRVPAGKGKLTLVVIDEDDNASEPISADFEYLTEKEEGEGSASPTPSPEPDQVKKAAGQPPVINLVTVTQLHTDDEERPHRYLLEVEAQDPEKGQLIYSWAINCGYFHGPANGPRVEWRYDTPGECVQAVLTVAVKDEEGLGAVKTQNVF